jgi:ceramide glucosyltransferase
MSVPSFAIPSAALAARLGPIAHTIAHDAGLVLALLAVVGILYQLVALHALNRWFSRDCPIDDGFAPLTLLKPLHGAEPRLIDNLASFLGGDHRGPVQMLCGVNLPGDAAVPAVQQLRAGHPLADIVLSPGPRAAGANGKIGNLVAMMPSAAHDVLVLSDSDMAVGPDYLPRVLGALSKPGVGIASCLYVGRGDAGIWSKLGATAISYAMMPGMVLALRFGLSQPCMGSTIALRRETLEAIGGFEAFRDTLADDYAIGAAVGELGLSVEVPPMLVTHGCDEASFGALWKHHLRWMVTLRGIVGATHLGTLVTHVLPLALLAALLAPAVGLPLLAAALVVRYLVMRKVDKLAGHRTAGFFWLCAADIIEFGIFLASLVAQKIDWRGARLVMAGDGRIQART